MKKLVIAAIFLFSFAAVSLAQTTPKKETPKQEKKEEKKEMKKHHGKHHAHKKKASK